METVQLSKNFFVENTPSLKKTFTIENNKTIEDLMDLVRTREVDLGLTKKTFVIKKEKNGEPLKAETKIEIIESLEKKTLYVSVLDSSNEKEAVQHLEKIISQKRKIVEPSSDAFILGTWNCIQLCSNMQPHLKKFFATVASGFDILVVLETSGQSPLEELKTELTNIGGKYEYKHLNMGNKYCTFFYNSQVTLLDTVKINWNGQSNTKSTKTTNLFPSNRTPQTIHFRVHSLDFIFTAVHLATGGNKATAQEIALLPKIKKTGEGGQLLQSIIGGDFNFSLDVQGGQKTLAWEALEKLERYKIVFDWNFITRSQSGRHNDNILITDGIECCAAEVMNFAPEIQLASLRSILIDTVDTQSKPLSLPISPASTELDKLLEQTSRMFEHNPLKVQLRATNGDQNTTKKKKM